MFNTLKRRLLFLALVTLAAFLWSGMFIFNLFLPKVPWQAQPVSSPVPIKSEQLTINSFKDGALLLSSEPLFSVENYELDRDRRRVIRHYAPPCRGLSR
ncbi:hypothetical protein [Entomohabitans teleogrylli]|uniref:hypothetical protein n=1 Tax=Entomohabitans teleogrylli TaxID=1384589 RepID=UPI00073D6665|nr:hypothetical protein [Entomohabitans teleogrylli]